MSAADISESEPGSHIERLEFVKTLAAVQAYNMFGLRDKADGIFRGDFMQTNLSEAAVHNDKVCPLVFFNRKLSFACPGQPLSSFR